MEQARGILWHLADTSDPAAEQTAYFFDLSAGMFNSIRSEDTGHGTPYPERVTYIQLGVTPRVIDLGCITYPGCYPGLIYTAPSGHCVVIIIGRGRPLCLPGMKKRIQVIELFSHTQKKIDCATRRRRIQKTAFQEIRISAISKLPGRTPLETLS
ncbi:MAG: hypothetical protein D3922_15130 [Candidatus Electrothrix sp. AR1]|nr:hypothetical protein [Candidatus Electrothrix sp. AR1]